MNKYIFLTFEGSTFQPNSSLSKPDIENVQMVGIGEGKTKLEAFEYLKNNNEWLLETSFDELYCHELKDNDFDYFYLRA